MAQILIAGGGIGGLSAALACARAGAQVALFERADAFSEVGAGIQLGPNVMRVLHRWGLKDALNQVVSFPDRLQVRSVVTGGELGCLRLGADMVQRYGAPYATIRRTDLHGLLVRSAQAQETVALHLGAADTEYSTGDRGKNQRDNDHFQKSQKNFTHQIRQR